MRLFDVLGPVMTGPSSSHTAGAVRIGLTARNLLGEAPVSYTHLRAPETALDFICRLLFEKKKHNALKATKNEEA